MKLDAEAMKLDAYEQEIEDSVDMSMLRDPDKALLKMLKEAARNTLKRDQRLGIRLTKSDLAGIKYAAETKGVSHQALISDVIHDYVIGALKKVEKPTLHSESVGS